MSKRQKLSTRQKRKNQSGPARVEFTPNLLGEVVLCLLDCLPTEADRRTAKAILAGFVMLESGPAPLPCPQKEETGQSATDIRLLIAKQSTKEG